MRKFRGIWMKFTDKTSSAKPDDKTGKYPKITLRVKISNAIPPNHRLAR